MRQHDRVPLSRRLPTCTAISSGSLGPSGPFLALRVISAGYHQQLCGKPYQDAAIASTRGTMLMLERRGVYVIYLDCINVFRAETQPYACAIISDRTIGDASFQCSHQGVSPKVFAAKNLV